MNAATVEKLGRDLRTLIADAEELVRATASEPGEKLEAVRARVEESLRDVRKSIAEIEEALADRARTADRLVRENPWTSIAVAGGAAFLLGLLIGRR